MMLDQRTSSNHKHDRGQTSGLKSVKTLKATFYPVRITESTRVWYGPIQAPMMEKAIYKAAYLIFLVSTC